MFFYIKKITLCYYDITFCYIFAAQKYLKRVI